MSGAAIRIEVQGEHKIGRALKRLMGRMKDLTPVMDAIGQELMTSTDFRFKTETDPKGVPWKPSMASYDRGPSPAGGRFGNPDRGKTLTDTGRLRQSINRRASRDEVIVGTNVQYAAIHQFGGKTKPHTIIARRKKALFWPGAEHPVKSVRHPGSNVPARPFLGISSGDERAIGDIVEAAMQKAWT